MRVTAEFESINDVLEFAKALAPLYQPDVGAQIPEPVAPAQKKKTTKQKETVKETPPAEPEEAADQDEADTAETAETDTADEKSATEEKNYTMEDVRAVLAALNKAWKRAEVKELLASFGVDKLSEIPKERYGEVMAKAGEL